MASNQPEINLADIIAPVFHEAHRLIRAELHTTIWLKGGRGSTKSSFAAIEIVLGIMKDPLANALCVRKVDNTVRKSIMANLLWAIDMLQVTNFWKTTFAPAELTYLPTGQKIICTGLDDPKNLKSIKVRKGYFKILWFEEADQFNGAEELRSVEQSILRGGEKFIEFITYNPPKDPNNWVNKESLLPNPDRFMHHSTYLDVPPSWLGNEFIKRAERLREQDFEKYRHEYLGEAVGNAEQIIFHGKYEVRDFTTPDIKDLFEHRFFYGVDWGFSQDPLAVTRWFIYGDCLYCDYEAGGIQIELEDIPATMDKVPGIRRWPSYADNSRPETISFIKRRNFNIEAAPKWEGSVEDGITFMKSFRKIYIHTRCVETAREFGIYQYKTDTKTQEILPVIVDKNNHYIDSGRYALSQYITRDVSILDVL